MSYRLAAYRELPRTGLPDIFDGWADYTRYVRVLEKAGAIRDASFLWWVMRPSTKYPTLELRVAGSCTRLSVRANLIDEADESTAPVTDRLATALALIAEAPTRLDAGEHWTLLREVARAGTSADRQIAIVDAARSRGRSLREALSDAVDWLKAATIDSTASGPGATTACPPSLTR